MFLLFELDLRIEFSLDEFANLASLHVQERHGLDLWILLEPGPCGGV